MSYLKPTLKKNNDNVVWAKILETAPGGFSLDTTGFTEGEILPAGTPLTFNASTRKAAKATPANVKGLLHSDVIVSGNNPVTIVLRGTIYTNRITKVDEAIPQRLPNIIFI